MKRIFSSHNLAVVHHFKNLLQGEGIRAVVRNEFLSSAMGDLPPAECQAELWVLRETDTDRAEALLKDIFSSKNAEPWRCAACAEALEAQFTRCWRCGADRA